jgi:nitrogen fixation/metabolism regulation signal transduction histidine kinase
VQIPAGRVFSEKFKLYSDLFNQQTTTKKQMAVAQQALAQAIDAAETNAFEQIEQIKKISNTVIFAAILIALVLGLVCAVFSTRIIVRPVARVAKVLQAIAEGEGDLTMRLDNKSKDEIGMLAYRFNLFIQKMAELIKQVADNVRQLGGASGDLSRIAGQISKGVDSMSEPANNVATAVEEMSSNMNSVAAASEQAQDPNFEEARKIWNAMIDRRPAVIVQCAVARDVVHALAFARGNGLEISIRGGGGNFDAITRFEFDLHPMAPEILAALPVFPIDQAKSVLAKYREFVKLALEEFVDALRGFG